VGTINKTKLENVLQRVDRSIEQDAGANLERGRNVLATLTWNWTFPSYISYKFSKWRISSGIQNLLQ